MSNVTSVVLDRLYRERPRIISIYWNSIQILRIERGKTVIEKNARPGEGLLTIHFNDSPIPVYSIVAQSPYSAN